MLKAKAFLLSPAELGVLILLKHTKEAAQKVFAGVDRHPDQPCFLMRVALKGGGVQRIFQKTVWKMPSVSARFFKCRIQIRLTVSAYRSIARFTSLSLRIVSPFCPLSAASPPALCADFISAGAVVADPVAISVDKARGAQVVRGTISRRKDAGSTDRQNQCENR